MRPSLLRMTKLNEEGKDYDYEVASSDFVYTSKSLFWPDVIMLAAT